VQTASSAGARAVANDADGGSADAERTSAVNVRATSLSAEHAAMVAASVRRGHAFASGFSAAELAERRCQMHRESALVLAKNGDVLDCIVGRTWRILTERWTPICRGLGVLGVSANELRGVKRALEYPVHSFDWCRSIVEGPSKWYLGDGRALAVDVIWFLGQVEGKRLRVGTWLAHDLVERYLVACAFDRVLSLGREEVELVLDRVFDQRVFDQRAFDPSAFNHSSFNQRVLGQRVFNHRRFEPDVVGGSALAGGVEASPLEAGFAAFRRFKRHDELDEARRERPSAVPDVREMPDGPRHARTDSASARSRNGVQSFGHRAFVMLAMLVGLPLESPFAGLGASEALLLERRARWLATFLREKPRSNNTPGSHLACGIIAVKRTLKELALSSERADSRIVQAERRRRTLIGDRNRAADLVYQSLLGRADEAVDPSRREHACNEELERLDEQLFRLRLEHQSRVMEGFARAWDDERLAGRVVEMDYERARAELAQPDGEPPALLPMGLVRSPAVWVFEYGMCLGRIALALAFAASVQVHYLALGLVLFGLNLYVIEPVVFKLQMSALGLFLEGPGHKLLDLRRYLQDGLPAGVTFRLPITVPKFSSNPAWTNLNAIIQAALTRSLTTSFTLVPFAMRRGQKHVTIELEDGAEWDVAARATALCGALKAELELGRAKFPLETRVSAKGRRVTITLTDDDKKIWGLIGDDASQAFIYLWRNLRALADTLSYLGDKFQPVFILASNTEDPDAVEYELAEIQKLQAWSDREYGGQVGFLYLLRGGEWCSYNSRLERFDEKDKTFARAVGHFKRQLSDPTTVARERVLCTLIQALEPKQIAAAFNTTLDDPNFFEAFAEFAFERLPPQASPTDDTLRLLACRRGGEDLPREELRRLNRELLLTALPMRVRGAFFKKVGNDIAVQELLVAGKTRPTTYVDRRVQEHVQDPALPNYARVWGDFGRYTGLAGTTPDIQDAILRGDDVPVESVPELGAILDDKNEFGAGEIEKGLATLLHPENRHVVIGVPRIDVTLPEHEGQAVVSEYILAAQTARSAHNAKDGLTRMQVFSMSSPAYGKWFKRPKPYLAHYARESLNAAHALSHDFQQSYLVAGASGRLGGFTEGLYGPKRFEVRAAAEPSLAATRASVAKPASAFCRAWTRIKNPLCFKTRLSFRNQRFFRSPFGARGRTR
jgi:hypothetical protein